jgi:hypothetical protein
MDFATKDTWRQGSSRSRSNAKFGTIYLVVFNVHVEKTGATSSGKMHIVLAMPRRPLEIAI